jgi:hypothetical protein
MSTDIQQSFQIVRDTLRVCRGEAQAVTIDELARRCGIGRRDCEALLETCFEDFPFVLASGSRGYFIPTSADEINAYDRSLQSRAVKIFLRRRRLIRKAQAAGWPRQGKLFANPPSVQGELFMVSRLTVPTLGKTEVQPFQSLEKA